MSDTLTDDERELLLSQPKKMVDWFAKDPEKPKAPSNEAALMNVEVIKALSTRELQEPRVKQAFLCRWCLNPVDEVPKTAQEYIPLRAVNVIPDSAKDPPICHNCYCVVLGSFNRNATNPGTRNDAPPNLTMRVFGAGT